MVVEHHFRAMASDVHCVLVEPADGVVEWVEKRLRELELCWSRFLPDSELSQLNALPEGAIRVSSDTLTLIETMQLAHTATGGSYDPTMLFEICQAGYDTSIDDRSRRSVFVNLPAIGNTVLDLIVNRTESTVWKPAGTGLDPGGIGKGLAADIVVSQLLGGGGAKGALISVGGDIAFAGTPPPSATSWHIGVDDPLGRFDEVMRIGINSGGVATSSTRSRRWSHRGREYHHILDPRHRKQSGTDLATVSVVASAGWLAEAHATAALLEGSEQTIAYLEQRQLTGVVVTDGGATLSTHDLAQPPLWIGAGI